MRPARSPSWSGRREVSAPPELVTRILFEISSGPSHVAVKPSWVRRIFGNRLGGKFLEPVLQPRYAMGMAMTLLSFAMLGRFAGIEVRHLTPSDLDPVKIWTGGRGSRHAHLAEGREVLRESAAGLRNRIASEGVERRGQRRSQ